ncbi:MAG: hypothetical protein KF863_21535 [Rubrivivax sp.]|nr:hypothetical protein [Rubrivivax sp.]
MSRTKFDPSSDAAAASRAAEGPLCRTCKAPAPGVTLSDFGGECYPCFAFRMRSAKAPELPPVPRGTVIPKTPHAWAYRLRARLDAGERLGMAQRGCLAEFERRYGTAIAGQCRDEHVAPEPVSFAKLPPLQALRG